MARFGEGQVTTYVILGMGEDPELTVEGCRRAVDIGVYPFVVPAAPGRRQPHGGLVAAAARVRRAHRPPGDALSRASGPRRRDGQSRLLALPRLLADGRGAAIGSRSGASRSAVAWLTSSHRGPASSCRVADDAWTSRGAPPHPPRGVRPTSSACSTAPTATSTTTTRRRSRCSASATVSPAGAVRLYPARRRGPLAGRPAGRPRRRSGPQRSAPRSCGSRSPTAASRGGRLMTAHIQPPNVALLRAPRAGGVSGEAETYVGVRTSRWPSRWRLTSLGLSPTSGRPVIRLGAQVDHRRGVRPPSRSASDARRRRACPAPRRSAPPFDGRPAVILAATAARSPGTRSTGSTAPTPRTRPRSGIGIVVHGRSVTPHRVGSSSIASDPKQPGHADVLRRCDDTGSRQLGQQPDVAGQCSPALVERGEEREVGPHRAVQAAEQAEPVAGRGLGSPTAAGPGQRPSANADSATAVGAVRQVAADDGHVVELGREAHPLEHRSDRSLSSPTIVSTIASGIAPIAATSLTLVSTAAMPAP